MCLVGAVVVVTRAGDETAAVASMAFLRRRRVEVARVGVRGLATHTLGRKTRADLAGGVQQVFELVCRDLHELVLVLFLDLRLHGVFHD